MSTIKDEAVILKRLDYSETSQVMAIFTHNHGKVRALAKGVKKSTRTRFAPALDLLDIGHVVLSVKTTRQEALANVTEWTQTFACGGLRESLGRLYAGQYAAALTAELTEDWDPHPELFTGLQSLLRELAENPDVLPPVIDFQRTLLTEIGSFPILNRCIGCDQPTPFTGNVHFSSLEGGLVCRDCEPAWTEKVYVQPEAYRWIIGQSGEEKGLKPAFSVFDYHISHLMGRTTPLAKMLLAACKNL